MVHHPQAGGGKITTDTDTIAAIATSRAVGAIGVIRLSGPKSTVIANLIAGESEILPRRVHHRDFIDAQGNTLDRGLLIYFPAPHSYTGEDICEFHCHGGPTVLQLILSRLFELGARAARPGEFTERSFLNGKMDLAQAEAVADLINSTTAAAARGAARSLVGEFSNKVRCIRDNLVELRVYIEAAIDFPEEEIDFLADNQVVDSIQGIETAIAELLTQTSKGLLLTEGLSVVIAGLPNAGKSSLLNRLAGQDRVIVTPIAGTTRDTVDVTIQCGGVAVCLTDTAGLRIGGDAVEQEGIDRAWKAISDADLVLYVIDCTKGVLEADLDNLRKLQSSRTAIVWNKIDLDKSLQQQTLVEYEAVSISALHGANLDSVYKLIQAVVGFDESEEGVFTARRRHLEALENASRYVTNARLTLQQHNAGELAAQDLLDAMNELGRIVGTVSADELLGEIFANFCIGK